jgi:hypothetical protein
MKRYCKILSSNAFALWLSQYAPVDIDAEGILDGAAMVSTQTDSGVMEDRQMRSLSAS